MHRPSRKCRAVQQNLLRLMRPGSNNRQMSPRSAISSVRVMSPKARKGRTHELTIRRLRRPNRTTRVSQHRLQYSATGMDLCLSLLPTMLLVDRRERQIREDPSRNGLQLPRSILGKNRLHRLPVQSPIHPPIHQPPRRQTRSPKMDQRTTGTGNAPNPHITG